MWQEIIEESIAQAMQSEHGGDGSTTYQTSVSRKTPSQKAVPTFNMRDAVDVSQVFSGIIQRLKTRVCYLKISHALCCCQFL